MIPKILALYLPQFHEVKENSEWYGKGFTDWVAVKNAKSLFHGHLQPRKPLHNNYYNLNKVETLKWQAELAKEYGIDGFCFYHYWFNSNTRLLEKPAELLLQHKEIDISYCFSWANESWKRTWNNVEKGNVWCDVYDNKSVKNNAKDRGLLAKQQYGREGEWEKHIEYLIPFFKDERYIKIDGKPVFCIYQPCDIACLRPMIDLWNKRLKEENIEGIYIIGASYGKQYSDNVNKSYNHEPGTAFDICRETGKNDRCLEGIEFFDYDILWIYILNEIKVGRLSCAFTDFDASPRKGVKGIIVKGSSPEKFEKYFKEFLVKNIQVGNEIVLINAWNEWGEGMYLEPCEAYGYGYLEAIKLAVQYIKNESVSVDDKSKADDFLGIVVQPPKKSVLQVAVLNKWLLAYRRGIRAGDFFSKYHYQIIAIYGMGILGRQLSAELSESDIQILYYIDQAEKQEESSLKKVSIEEKLPEVDCIVVTVLAEFSNIYDMLKEKSSASIVNISEIYEDLF